MPEILWVNAAAVAGLMLALWCLSLILRDASIVDPVWGLGFVIIAWITFAAAGPDARDWLPPVLCTVWGLRLSLFLAWRNHGQGEDARYASMRDRHGQRFPLVSLFSVFGLQGAVMWIVSLPLQAAQSDAHAMLPLQLLGTAVWGIGFFFEAVGDGQLARFKANPGNKGRVMDQGLWRYTRHPNYFGDCLIWWGLFGVAFATGAPWWTAVGPLVMTFCLLKFSGVTLLEKSLHESKPHYAEYAQRTSAFIPLPPSRASQQDDDPRR